MCVIKIKLLTPFLTLNFRFRSLITYFVCCHFNVSSFFDYFFFRRMPFLQREINEQIREMNIFVYLLDLTSKHLATIAHHLGTDVI